MRLALIVILGLTLSAFAQNETPLNRDPKLVKFVTSDIDNFWLAYDAAAKETDRAKRVAIFQSEYLDKGSAGLKDFVTLRIKSADSLVSMIDKMPRYYASIRPSTLRVKTMEKRMRKSFAKFKSIYPDAVFPDVYFLVGISNTGGTTGQSGLLIGAEMYGKTPATPYEELPAWLRTVLNGVDKLPGIVAHESCHYNQNVARPLKTVLARSLQEGSCDLVGELISGQNINEHLKAFERDHGDKLRADFLADMNTPEINRWMYNGTTAKDRPADLGYLMGYLISRAYYEKSKNKPQAIRDILTIQDYPAFLEKSGYPVRPGSSPDR